MKNEILQKLAVAVLLTMLFPIVFTFGYLAIMKTAVIDK